MTYQALYRRYRPQRFADVRGQQQVVEALRNAVRDDRIGHAYLFSGPRGTGKTSTARILAKALNCTNLVDGEPCGTCESCVDVEAGRSYDLVELDAASNNRVENIRDLIKTVALTTGGRTKVYILDEVHMLTQGASNALLKTLEEPPDHVVFVLATTDPVKVLPTIRSRTQHFEFHLLPADELADHVRWVIGDAGLEVTDDGVEYVLRQGGGSARDTLSALDQVAVSGAVDDAGDEAERLVDAVCDADAGAALRAVADAVATGRDPRSLANSLLANLRDVFLHRMGDPLEQVSEGRRQQVMVWAERIGDRATTRALEEVGAALQEMPLAPEPRIPLEVALVRLTRVEMSNDVSALAARVERLERTLATVTAADGGAAQGAGAVADGTLPGAPPPELMPTPPPPRPPPGPRRPGPTPPPPAPTAATPDPGSTERPAVARPGDAARAALQGSGGANAVGTTTAPSVPPADRPTAPSRPDPERAAEPVVERRPTPGTTSAGEASPPRDADLQATPTARPARPPDAPPAPPTASGAAPGPSALPDRDALTLSWADAVLPVLNGLTRAMFAVGRFVDVKDGRAVFAVPNQIHRQKCQQKQAEVEAALAAQFGLAVPLLLVVDTGSAGAAGPDDGGGSDHDEFDRPDLSDLRDAPVDTRTPVDRLSEAFPGSQLLEEDAP